MLRFFYRSIAFFLSACIFLWLVLAFLFSKPREIEFGTFQKSIIEWIIGSDDTQISSESAKLIIDGETFQDHLVLKNISLIKKSTSEKFGTISQIQIRFNCRSLIQRFYTQITLVIVNASISLIKEKSQISKSVDNIFEYFVSLIEKGILDFKNLSFVNVSAEFPSLGKLEVLKITSAQMSISEEDSKVRGKVFYEFNKVNHNFDFLASYEDARYFKLDCKFNKLPLHLALQHSNLDKLKNFQNDKNFLEVSGNIEHFFDRKLRKYQNKITIDDAVGLLYFPESATEFLRINKFKSRFDFSDSWFDIKDFILNLNDNQSVSISSEITKNGIENLDAQLKNLPISLYKFLSGFSSTESIFEFLNSSFYSGAISGNLSLRLKEDFLEETKFDQSFIKANVQLTDVKYVYDTNFPAVEKANALLTIKNNDVNINVTSGETAESQISQANVHFCIDSFQEKKHNIFITAKARGPASGIVHFIPSAEQQKLKNSGMDLMLIKGEANTDAKIITSIHKELEEKYDIKSSVSDASLDIFDKNIHIKNINLKGTFNGEVVSLNGTTEINGQKSELEYSYIFDQKQEFDNILKIKVHILPILSKHQAIRVVDGSGSLYFELLGKNSNIKYTTKADLTNVDFIIDKIGLVKPLGLPTTFSFNGQVSDTENKGLLKLLADNNSIDIKAKVQFVPNGIKIIADNVKYYDTNLKAEYSEIQNHARLSVHGDVLDLSKANLFKILNKESSNKSSETHVQAAKVKLKDEISLTKFNLHILCNKDKCFKGEINSSMDDQDKEYFKMWINDSDNQETWSIESNNAGKMLRAFDINKTINNGLINLNIKTTRNLNDLDEQISITKGIFQLKNFSTTNDTFAIKMISFLSFPGLPGAILRNEIKFNEMHSKFEYSLNHLSFSNGSASGPVFDFTFQGEIDTEKREYAIKGKVIPSLFGINDAVNWILNNAPGIGKLLSYGKRKGLLIAPYRIKEKY